VKKILFVCLGNICRSPSAEGVMKALLKKEGLDQLVHCDSAGTVGHHVGEEADPRSQRFAQKRGYQLTSRARKFISNDLKEFDLILTMDRNNLRDVLQLDQENLFTEKVKLFTDFCSNKDYDEVPDPYYSGDSGFDLVLDILEDGVNGILQHLKEQNRS
jgi:protein-tyrosine phosphatase